MIHKKIHKIWGYDKYKNEDWNKNKKQENDTLFLYLLLSSILATQQIWPLQIKQCEIK